MNKKAKSHKLPENVDSAKARILEAAFNLFRDKGFKSTTTQQITKAAGVNEVTLFRLFGSKRHLFSAVIDEFIISGSIASFDEEFHFQKYADSPEAFFHELANAVFNHFKANMPFVKMHIFESSMREDIDQETLDKLAEVALSGKKKIEGILLKCAERGWIEKRKSYDSLVVSFIGPFFNYLMNLNTFQRKIFQESEEYMVKSINDNFLNGALSKN